MCDSNFEHADWFVSLFFCDVASLLKNSQFWECFSLSKVLYIQLWTRCGFTLSCLVWFSVSKYTFVKINSWNSPLSSNLILNLIFFSFYVGVIFVFSACIWNILMNETEYFFYRKKLFFLTVFYIVTAWSYFWHCSNLLCFLVTVYAWKCAISVNGFFC